MKNNFAVILTAWVMAWTILLLVVAAADAGHWAWTPDAAHHRSIGVIKQMPYSGTAFLVSPNHIATAAHCVDQNNRAVWLPPGGQPIAATVVYRGDVVRESDGDIALLRLDRPITDRPTIPIAAAKAPAGSQLEICGYGGPTNTLRHFHSVMRSDDTCHSSVLNGDSGGPILYRGQCVGIVSGGNNVKTFMAEGNTTWRHVYPVAYGYPTPLRSFFFGYQQPANNGYS